MAEPETNMNDIAHYNTNGAPDENALLMLRVSEGDDHALRLIIERWKNPLMAFFFRSVRNAHSAEDMASQTFVRLYKSRFSYAEYFNDKTRGTAKFSTYLFFIARNVLISEHRKSQTRPFDATDPSDLKFSTIPSSSNATARDIEEIFYSTVRSMPENQRTAILLLKQQELTYEEIAETMKSNVSSVKTWIFRARQTLKEALRDV